MTEWGNMIKINDAAFCSAFKDLRGVNIYQQSVKRQNSSHQGYFESSTFHPDGCELFSSS